MTAERLPGGEEMKYTEALKIINSEPGYMVSFEWAEGGMLRSDCFPDKHSGEELIKTEREAWEIARKFASKTVGRCVNIYVIRGDNFTPVGGYEIHKIANR